MAFCHAVTRGQQGCFSYGLVQPTSEVQKKKRRYCMKSPALQLHPRPRLAAGKEAAFLHGSTSCWCRQTCEPSEWVSEEYVCAPMHDVGRRAWCVRPFELFLPETRALSLESTVVLFAHASRLAYRACAAKIGEFMRHLVRVIGWRVCCSPCAHHLACRKSNNAEALHVASGAALPSCVARKEDESHVVIVAAAFAHDMPRSASAVNIRNS